MKSKTLIIAAALALSGCANSFKDLGDGQGMRGWGGMPLKDSIPIGASMMVAGANLQAAQANENAANAASRAAIISSMQRPYTSPTPGTVNIYIPPVRVPTWSNPNGY